MNADEIDNYIRQGFKWERLPVDIKQSLHNSLEDYKKRVAVRAVTGGFLR